MAAVGVGAELDLVHRDELGVAVERHRLHGAGEPARLGRHDLLLAGDQGDVARALCGDHAVVVLARQQAQREADDARAMGEQAFDRKMGLAGVGRAEHGPHPRREQGAGARSESRHGEDVRVAAAQASVQVGLFAAILIQQPRQLLRIEPPSLIGAERAERRPEPVRRAPTPRVPPHSAATPAAAAPSRAASRSCCRSPSAAASAARTSARPIAASTIAGRRAAGVPGRRRDTPAGGAGSAVTSAASRAADTPFGGVSHSDSSIAANASSTNAATIMPVARSRPAPARAPHPAPPPRRRRSAAAPRSRSGRGCGSPPPPGRRKRRRSRARCGGRA